MPATETSRPPWSAVGARLGEVLLVAILAGVVGTVLWASRRGFDLTDEGYYLQLYTQSDNAPAGSSQFHRLVGLLPGSREPGIIGYRVAGLLVLLGAAAVLARGVLLTLRRFQPHLHPALPSSVAVTSFIAVAGLLGYSWLPLTLSYNTLSAALAEVGLGLMLISVGRYTSDSTRHRTRWLPGVLAGVAVGLLVFVKWPSAVLMAVLVVVVCGGLLGPRRAVRPNSVFIGSLLGSLLVVTVPTGWFSFADLSSGSSLAASSSHEPAALAVRYVSDLGGALAGAFTESPLRLIALVALYSGWRLPGRSSVRHTWFRRLLAGAGAAYLLVEVTDAAYLDRRAGYTLAVSVVVAALVAITVMSRRRSKPISTGSPRLAASVWLMCSLLLLPLAVAVGTNNHLVRGSLVAAASYGAFLVVALAVVGSRAEELPVIEHGLALSVVGFLLAAQAFSGTVVDPYRLPTSRLEQVEPVVGIARLHGILLDPPGAEFLEQVNRVVLEQTNYEPGDRVLAFAKLPGLVYMLGAVGPGDLWINPPESGLQTTDCEQLAAHPEDVALTRLVLQNDKPSLELEGCLRDLIPGYPESFLEVGRIAIPGTYGAGTGSGTVLQILELRG